MWSLLSGLYRYLTRKEEYNVLVLGLDNAGKTTLLERIKNLYIGTQLRPDKILPTTGLNIGKIDLGFTRINFQDLGGQTDLQSIWKAYYDDAHAVIFMVDSTDADRLEEVRSVFERTAMEVFEGLPILTLANKQDLEGALSIQAIKEVFNKIAVKLDARESGVMAVSALKGDGVREAVDWLYTRLLRNREARPPFYKEM